MFQVKAIKEQIGEARKRKHAVKNERQNILKQVQKIRKKPPKMTQREWDETIDNFKTQINAKDQKIEQENDKIESLLDKLAEVTDDIEIASGPVPSGIHPGTNGSGGNSENVELWESVSGDDKGKKIKVLSNRASLKQEKGLTNEGYSMAEYLRDRVRGYTSGNSFANEMSTTTDAALVPTPLAAGLIDKARAKSRIFSAGAMTVDMDSKTLTIAKVSEDASVQWKQENQSHTPSDVSFEPLTFTAKTLIGSVKSSVELAEDSGNLASLVEDNLAQQIALELDRAAMLGNGVDPEPTGIVNTGGVQMKTLGPDGGPLTDYSEFSIGVERILAANGQPNAVIYAPRTWGTVDRLTAADGQPLMAPESYKNLAKYQTEQVPSDLTLGTSNDASLAIIGDWSQLMIGIRSGIRLEVTRVGSAADSSAWEKLQIWFRAYARYDVQLAHPEHFYVINGIVPA